MMFSLQNEYLFSEKFNLSIYILDKICNTKYRKNRVGLQALCRISDQCCVNGELSRKRKVSQALAICRPHPAVVFNFEAF